MEELGLLGFKVGFYTKALTAAMRYMAFMYSYEKLEYLLRSCHKGFYMSYETETDEKNAQELQACREEIDRSLTDFVSLLSAAYDESEGVPVYAGFNRHDLYIQKLKNCELSQDPEIAFGRPSEVTAPISLLHLLLQSRANGMDRDTMDHLIRPSWVAWLYECYERDGLTDRTDMMLLDRPSHLLYPSEYLAWYRVQTALTSYYGHSKYKDSFRDGKRLGSMVFQLKRIVPTFFKYSGNWYLGDGLCNAAQSILSKYFQREGNIRLLCIQERIEKFVPPDSTDRDVLSLFNIVLSLVSPDLLALDSVGSKDTESGYEGQASNQGTDSAPNTGPSYTYQQSSEPPKIHYVKGKELDKKIKEYAEMDENILILGESGSGKEYVAEQIHDNSSRKDKDLVPVNCGALPKDTIESELFGYKRGAFTGANNDKIGSVEQAEDGTLLLDEIGEIKHELQVKLLRFLDDHTYNRLGDPEPRSSNAVVIAATHNLDGLRDDIKYRFPVQLYLTPLRDRKEEIPKLAKDAFKDIKINDKKRIKSDEYKKLCEYDWPGNVRQLRNAIKTAYATHKGGKYISASFIIDLAKGNAN